MQRCVCTSLADHQLMQRCVCTSLADHPTCLACCPAAGDDGGQARKGKKRPAAGAAGGGDSDADDDIEILDDDEDDVADVAGEAPPSARKSERHVGRQRRKYIGGRLSVCLCGAQLWALRCYQHTVSIRYAGVHKSI
jgi:hypothetical protein